MNKEKAKILIETIAILYFIFAFYEGIDNPNEWSKEARAGYICSCLAYFFTRYLLINLNK